MTKPVASLTSDLMLTLASAGLGKVDLWGPRGITMLSTDELDAMVCLLAALGLVPTVPGQPAPAEFFITPEKEA